MMHDTVAMNFEPSEAGRTHSAVTRQGQRA
jgi:hypothetical protein